MLEGLAKVLPPSHLSLSRGHGSNHPTSIYLQYYHQHRTVNAQASITHSNATMPPSPTATPGSPPLFQHHSPAPHSLNTPPHPPPASHSPSGSHHHPVSASASASASGSPRPRAAFQPPSSSSRQTRDRDEEARRSLQARGKNYNTTPGTWSRGGRGETAAVAGSTGEGGGGWTWEARQRRDEAARILESEELLMWFAGVRCEVSFSPFFPPPTSSLFSHILAKGGQMATDSHGSMGHG